MYIGIDFGSTYTTISEWDGIDEKPKALNMAQSGSPNIPSVVTRNKKTKELSFGVAAKSKTGNLKETVFKGFKMMLPETDAEKLTHRGFDAENSPELITTRFLEHYLERVLKDREQTVIDNLVIGVPEIWNSGMLTLDGRRIVRDICLNLQLGKYGKAVKKVQVVSEPAAASVYFAYHYLQKYEQNYEGKILLIDYGGGTLDITLTEIEKSSRDNAVEIRVLDRTGAGDNEDGEIGRAGIIYMETVVREAIEQAGVTEIERDRSFYKLVNSFETQIQAESQKIEDLFDEYGIDHLEEDLDEDDNVFMEGEEYKDTEIIITFSLMADVYRRVIYDVLDEQIDKIMAFMAEQNISCEGEDFKIALVGGFGNFYLVRQQVKDRFADSFLNDSIIESREDREQAISLGAALLSAGIIGIRNTAPYSIGINYKVEKENRKNNIRYAFLYKQDIEFGTPYYPIGTDGEIIQYFIPGGGIENIIYNHTREDRTAIVVEVKDSFKERLRNLTSGCATASIGFSLDSSEVLSIHILDYDLEKDCFAEHSREVELAEFSKLVDIQKLRKVFE